MLGAICGDAIGSRHEHRPTKTSDFELLTPRCGWTDDTVCTVAVAEALLDGSDIGDALASWARRHPGAGYGQQFWAWSGEAIRRPYGSWGNGAGMRVSLAGWLAADLGEAAALGARTAEPRYLSGRLFRNTRAIVDACCEAWNALVAEAGRIRSLTNYEWARPVRT